MPRIILTPKIMVQFCYLRLYLGIELKLFSLLCCNGW